MDATYMELAMIRWRMSRRYVRLMRMLFSTGLSIDDADRYAEMTAKDRRMERALIGQQ
ncbi:MAG: hypothetical protein WC455_22705 [Dehalococcoidia bacterium]